VYTANEKLSSANITDIMQTAYIDYSMSVIISRALPDARDGLKPVQRRILYAMLREGLLHNRAFDKCAGVVGEVLKNYHPHGDSSVYDTLVRMAQNWVMRYPLIDPQGNFGSVDGDPPAAYRYTEARLKDIAEDLLKDIEEDTVDFAPNYKESTTEPTVLPSALPNLLMNGSTGIAVGMTTNIPPHNLDEIIDATCAIIDRPGITVDELVLHRARPRFPTGGSSPAARASNPTSRPASGIVRMRGKAHTEELKGGMEQIVITEIPYNVNRATLVTPHRRTRRREGDRRHPRPARRVRREHPHRHRTQARRAGPGRHQPALPEDRPRVLLRRHPAGPRQEAAEADEHQGTHRVLHRAPPRRRHPPHPVPPPQAKAAPTSSRATSSPSITSTTS
jgi:DNA gyrase subunit A